MLGWGVQPEPDPELDITQPEPEPEPEPIPWCDDPWWDDPAVAPIYMRWWTWTARLSALEPQSRG